MQVGEINTGVPSSVKIADRKELSEFVRTHLGHRLTAMVAPVCIPGPFWHGRNDAYRAAKEGSYSMLRMFIEFLGVKSKRREAAAGIPSPPPTLCQPCDEKSDDILIDAFSHFGAQKLKPSDFGDDEGTIARMHRALCKINAHFTYDQSKPNLDDYDRIASPHDVVEWGRVVDIVVQKLDKHFYAVVGEDIVVHSDLAALFIDHFKTRLGLQSAVRGDGLGRP